MSYQAMSLHSFASSFGTEASCLAAIEKRRWPTGWLCRKCSGTRCYRLRSRRVLQCAAPSCRAQSSITRGTIFEQMKIPLPKAFLAIYLMTDKQGISAMSLAKHLNVAYNTAFDLLHKLREAMGARDMGYTLGGILQVDEAYVGGHGDGKHRRGRSQDTKCLIGVAVEQRGSNVTGNIHIDVLPAPDAEALHGMILEKIRKGSTLLTDCWKAYRGIESKGFIHDPIKSRGGKAACEQWLLVHRAVSNFKSWLLGTHRNFCQGRLRAYAAEYCWRSNRRNMSKEEYRKNLREPLLPDRLLTLCCRARHRTTESLRKTLRAA